ncbi:uncharacterized protein LOC119725823 [Patiria miniata]|uniref:Ig-like domain-containing protein n=1 Tax=Patiria miniata TaxID=46514 RepID=A0A913ZNM7_PATMI|nr:uncharacterized protein LOC119725823 [Patiria miniata]
MTYYERSTQNWAALFYKDSCDIYLDWSCTAMESTVTLLVVLLVSVHTQAQTTSPVPVAVMFVGPQQNANSGSTVRLNCSIEYQASANISLQILHEGNEIIMQEMISAMTTHQSSRYQLSVAQPESSKFLVFLDILNVGRADSGTYTCKATRDAASQVTTEEAIVELQINYLPPRKYPLCSTLGEALPEPIRQGQVVTLLCSSRTSEPTVVLNWFYAGGTDVRSVTETESENYVQSELTVALLYPSTGEAPVFRCEATSDAFTEYRSSCTRGPFNIAPPTENETIAPASGPPSSTSAAVEGANDSTGENSQPSVASPAPSESSQSATPPPTSDSNQLLSNASWMLVIIIVLACLLLISVIINIFSIVRRRRGGSALTISQDDHYQGLDKVDEKGTYTSLTTPALSLQAINKKSEVLQASDATKDSEQDYAQVDLSPNSESKPIHLEDPKYVNYKKRKPKRP